MGTEDIEGIIKAHVKEDLAAGRGFHDRKIHPMYAESSMSNWWPKIKDLDVPQPRTIMVPVEETAMIGVLDGEPIPNIGEMERAVRDIGSPTFVRNNVSSGKHHWKDSCFLENPDKLPRHVYGVTEYTLMSTMGEVKIDSMFFREFIQLEQAGFSCFLGKMPISKEVRCFVRNGAIECRHPYWFDGVFKREEEMETAARRHRKEMGMDDTGSSDHLPSDWRAKLKKANRMTRSDNDAIMSHLFKIMPHFDGYWSVDFVKGIDGAWYLIDMARGEVSYHYEGCRHAPG